MIQSGICRNVKLRFEYWPLIWLWPIGLVLMQLTLVRVADFSLTIGVIACHVLQIYLITFYWINRPPNWQVVTALVVLAYSLVLGIYAADNAEFWRTFAQLANLVVMILICLNVRIDRGREVESSLVLFCLLASAIALVIVAQAISFNLFHDFRLARLLADFSPRGPGEEIYAPLPSTRLPRANGVYSEPSVAGWFMSFATAMALALRRLHPTLGTVAAAICSLAAMATLSLTGILGSALVLIGYLVLVRDSLSFKTIWALVAGATVIAAIYYAHQLGILARFANVDNPGTSIYFRLTAPYWLIAESLERFPLGYPLGQTDFIASRHYYINWEQGSQTNIDNTLLMIVFYFGLFGVLFNLAYVIKALQFLLLKRHVIGLFMLSLLIALCTTGAGWAHHFVLMIGYAIIVGRYLLGQGMLGLPPRRAPRSTLIPRHSGGPPARAAPPRARPRAAWRRAAGVP